MCFLWFFNENNEFLYKNNGFGPCVWDTSSVFVPALHLRFFPSKKLLLKIGEYACSWCSITTMHLSIKTMGLAPLCGIQALCLCLHYTFVFFQQKVASENWRMCFFMVFNKNNGVLYKHNGFGPFVWDTIYVLVSKLTLRLFSTNNLLLKMGKCAFYGFQ